MGQCRGALQSEEEQQPLTNEAALATPEELKKRIENETNGWLKPDDLAPSLRKFLRKRLEEERQGKQFDRLLSESDVCGPVVGFAQQSLVTWLCASVFFTVAYCAMEQGPSKAPGSGREITGFVQYPDWLIYIGLLPALHIWWVQHKCLQYMVLPQVLLLRQKAFKILWLKIPYRAWYCIQVVLTSANVIDIVAQCLFFAQFLRSVQYNPRILEEWRRTFSSSLLENHVLPVFENLVCLFAFSWALMFLQVIAMVLHMCPMEGMGVDYRFASMKEGYTTVASFIFWEGVNSWEDWNDGIDSGADGSEVGTNSNSVQISNGGEVGHVNSNQDGGEVGHTDSDKPRVAKRRLRLFRHADVVRFLSAFGRMPALISSKAEVARLNIETDAVRYLQIAHNRLCDRLWKILLMDLFEKTAKLQVQITLLSLDLGLDMGVHDAASRQMFLSCALSLFSCGLSSWNHVISFIQLLRRMGIRGKVASDSWQKCMQRKVEALRASNPNKATKLEEEMEKRQRYIRRSICCLSIVLVIYGVCLLLLVAVQLHAGVKLYMVFLQCHGPWNLNGCVAHGNFEEGSPEDLKVAEALTVT